MVAVCNSQLLSGDAVVTKHPPDLSGLQLQSVVVHVMWQLKVSCALVSFSLSDPG